MKITPAIPYVLPYKNACVLCFLNRFDEITPPRLHVLALVREHIKLVIDKHFRHTHGGKSQISIHHN